MVPPSRSSIWASNGFGSWGATRRSDLPAGMAPRASRTAAWRVACGMARTSSSGSLSSEHPQVQPVELTSGTGRDSWMLTMAPGDASEATIYYTTHVKNSPTDGPAPTRALEPASAHVRQSGPEQVERPGPEPGRQRGPEAPPEVPVARERVLEA